MTANIEDKNGQAEHGQGVNEELATYFLILGLHKSVRTWEEGNNVAYRSHLSIGSFLKA